MKKFLWIAFLSFCFSGVAAESDWNADSVQVYFSRSVTPVVQKNWKDHKLILKTYRQFLKTCESVPDSVLKQCSWCFIDTYYNMACCESMMKPICFLKVLNRTALHHVLKFATYLLESPVHNLYLCR